MGFLGLNSNQVIADLFVLHGALNLSIANMAMTSLTLAGNSADSSEPILRPLPAMSPDTEILDISARCLGYDAENFPYQQA